MSEQEPVDSQGPLWEVFVQEEGGAAHVHAGSLHAPDRDMALQNARDVYARRGRVASLWVVESAAIAATAPSDRASFFEPAFQKIYRHPQFYKVPRGIRGL
jgi:ring-1,2-phenylacetyl-CoA epoxidase subunit PaaB